MSVGRTCLGFVDRLRRYGTLRLCRAGAIATVRHGLTIRIILQTICLRVDDLARAFVRYTRLVFDCDPRSLLAHQCDAVRTTVDVLFVAFTSDGTWLVRNIQIVGW